RSSSLRASPAGALTSWSSTATTASFGRWRTMPGRSCASGTTPELNLVLQFTMSSLSFGAHVMAVERVERRLRLVAGALDAAGIPYAVIGGNAVAAWVGRVDPGATRATRDV